jgi:predicted ArsR family transcriptional regulator
MANGYIKLYRSMLEWDWYKDSKAKDLFIHLLLKAAWEDDEWQGVEIRPGQAITTVAQLAEELRLSTRSIRTSLDKLKTTNELSVKTSNRYSLITIVNWAKYQARDDGEGNQNDKPYVAQATNKRQTKAVSSYHIKNKEYKKEEVYGHLFDRFWNAYPRKIAKQAAQKAFNQVKPEEALLVRMLTALERQKKSTAWTKDDGQFIPHAATWLNGRRWEDETEAETDRSNTVISYLKPDGTRGEYRY